MYYTVQHVRSLRVLHSSPTRRSSDLVDLLTARVADDLDPRLLMRARGALLGLVVGNQLGVPTEPLGTATAIREAFPQGVRDLAAPPEGSPFDDEIGRAHV